MDNWTNAKWCDVANLILGAFLFFSPWIFGFDAGKVSQNAYIAGIVIAVLAIAALAAFAVWEEWLNLIVGLWVLVSPWVLGFQGTMTATKSSTLTIASERPISLESPMPLLRSKKSQAASANQATRPTAAP